MKFRERRSHRGGNAGINLTSYHPPGHLGAFAPKCVPSPRALAQKMPGGVAREKQTHRSGKSAPGTPREYLTNTHIIIYLILNL